MATGFSGRKLLIKIGDGASPEVFSAFAAITDTTVTFDNPAVDTTTKDDSGNRSLLAGKTVFSMTVSGTGIFVDDADLATAQTSVEAGTHNNFQIDVVETDATTAGKTHTGAFRITSLEFTGTHDGAANYSITLESDGAITVA